MHNVYVGDVISHDGSTPVTCVGVRIDAKDTNTAAALDLVTPMGTRLPSAEKGQKPPFVVVPLAGDATRGDVRTVFGDRVVETHPVSVDELQNLVGAVAIVPSLRETLGLPAKAA